MNESYSHSFICTLARSVAEDEQEKSKPIMMEWLLKYFTSSFQQSFPFFRECTLFLFSLPVPAPPSPQSPSSHCFQFIDFIAVEIIFVCVCVMWEDSIQGLNFIKVSINFETILHILYLCMTHKLSCSILFNDLLHKMHACMHAYKIHIELDEMSHKM